MKLKFTSLAALTCGMTICVLLAHSAAGQFSNISTPGPISPPVILTQPFGQSLGHGENVAFTVRATGSPLAYRWRRNGAELGDYENVAGAGTDTLILTGVGQSDAGRYTVVVGNEAGAVTSAVAVLKVGPFLAFHDSFESGNLKNWRPMSAKTRLSISTNQNHTANGSWSALVTNSVAKMYHNLGTKLAGHARATFWIFDDGGGQTRCLGELRGHTGPGYGKFVPKNFRKQLFAIGRYEVGFGKNNTGALVSERVNTKNYQGMLERGRNTGWFNLDAPGAPNRSVGWHKFEIERSASGTVVTFRVDGVVGRVVTGVDHILLDCVTIGSVAAGNRGGNAWIDDVTVEAFPWRYDWVSKNSDGKGLFDWMKFQETGFDPVVTSITQTWTVSHADGSAGVPSFGRWVGEGTGIYAADLRGSVDYTVNAPSDDVYRIEVEGREHGRKGPAVKLPLILSIDGEYLGRFVLPYGPKTNGFVHCFTPFIKAGKHTVRVFWDNSDDHNSLYLQALRLQSLLGGAVSANGMKKWVENRLEAQCGTEFAPGASLVSPVCVEGRGQYLSMMAMLAGVANEHLSPVAVHPGAGHRWYADIELTPGKPTWIEVYHQNGGLRESTDINWQVTNLLETNSFALRKGDALLLTALPQGATEGEVSIVIAGVTNYTTDAATPVVHRFDQAGTFMIVGGFNGQITGFVTVQVVEASLDSPAAWAGKRRFWDCTNLPSEVVVEADPRLKLTPVPDSQRQLQRPKPPPLGPNGRQFSATIDAAEPRVVVARLGADGPVLASTAVRGFRLFSGSDTYLRLMHRYEDGSQSIEAGLVLSPMVPDLSVGLRIIVAGVTFEDGTLTKTLRASDFDDLGFTRVRFIRAAGVKTSVCHTVKAYQNGMLIGWPAYEK